MDQLRQDPRLLQQAAAILGKATRNVPPLSQMGVAASLPGNLPKYCQVTSVEQLYQATTLNKQLHCYEFAACAQFSYRSQLEQDNYNATSFAHGALKHLESFKRGGGVYKYTRRKRGFVTFCYKRLISKNSKSFNHSLHPIL